MLFGVSTRVYETRFAARNLAVRSTFRHRDVATADGTKATTLAA
jgi:hypothetical protein